MKRSSLLAYLLVGALLALFGTPRGLAQCEERILEPDPPDIYTFFGWAVAVSGDYAVVGSPGDDEEGLDAGAAYVYRKIEFDWTRMAKITAPDAKTGDRFGSAVAIDGDFIVVGASERDLPDAGAGAGAAFVFQRYGEYWLPVGTLTASDAGFQDRFGYAVDVQGNTVLVGAPLNDIGGTTDSGAAYVFQWNGTAFVEEKRIVPDPAAAERFGWSVSLDGGVAYVGAPGKGVVAVHERALGQWTLVDVLESSDGPGGAFGYSVAFQGDRGVVGSTVRDAAYVFELQDGNWAEVAKLDGGGPSLEGFGTSVSLDGDLIVIGNPRDDEMGANSGSVSLYRRNGTTWELVEVMIGSLVQGSLLGSYFGVGVAIDAGFGFFGAAEYPHLDGVGKAYIFWVADKYCDCAVGTVNGGAGDAVNVLFVNGRFGGANRTVEVEDGETVFAYLLKPPMGGNGKYVVHADLGRPNPTTLTPLPASVGTTCFPFLLTAGAEPVAIWNGLGKTNVVGESDYFGTPITNPLPAPSVFLELPTGDPVNLPAGTVLTLQGIVIDPGSASPKGGSATNAVILRIQ